MNAVARNFMSDADPAIALAVQTELQTADWRQAEGWNDLAGIADKVTPTSLVVYTEAMSVEGSRVTVPADLTVH